MALQGTLDTFALPDVLRLLAATKKTGRLHITGDRGTGSVWVTSGEVAALEAPHAPHATELVDALFELLRFQDGAFTFDAEATPDDPGRPTDVEILVQQSEALLAEWRDIEAVVPSMDAWVTLRKSLPLPEITVDQDRWTTISAVGAGATVRRIGDELCLAELPTSRAIKELSEAGLVEIADTAPAGAMSLFNGSSPTVVGPLVAPKAEEPPPAAPAPFGPRARRTRAVAVAPVEPETFVPLDLPSQGVGVSYDPVDEPKAGLTPEVHDLVAAFPGLANQLTPTPSAEDDEEREAALDAVEGEDRPPNRGLLLKFLSSVKS